MTWDQPQEIDSATRVARLLPAYGNIPKDFRDSIGRNKWQRFQEDWFFEGLNRDRLVCKEGIDAKKALRHLAVIQGSFEPKHEHKRAAVAYLASLWFDDYKAAKDGTA